MRTFIIAEAGSSHDGELAKAKRLVRVAKWAGADAVKGQYWSSPQRLAIRRHTAELALVYAKYQMPREWLDLLKAECDSVGIEWMATCYLQEDLVTVAPSIKRFKVASFEAGDRAFLAAHLPYRKPLVISTGMMTLQQVQALADWLAKRLEDAEVMHDTALLHCVSAYPCPLDQAQLGVMRTLRELWHLVGLSDHTGGEWTGGLAVATGARVIEVHLRLGDTDPANPDYPHSLTPAQLQQYIEHVRLAETMIGTGIKAPQEAERIMMRYRVQGEGGS